MYNKFLYTSREIKKSLKNRQEAKAYLKTLLCFSFYDYFYNKVYVSDSKIAKQANISREWANKTKHVLQADGLISIENRGANKTCITKVSVNIFNDPELIHYLINDIKALAGVFKYHFTRFLKISHLYLINKIFKSINRTKKEKELDFLYELSKTFNNGRISTIKEEKFTMKQEICLGVFPLSAIQFAIDTVKAYPLKIRNKFKFIRYMCSFYCRRHNIPSFEHLSFWIYKVLNINPENGMINDYLEYKAKENTKKSNKDDILETKPVKKSKYTNGKVSIKVSDKYVPNSRSFWKGLDDYNLKADKKCKELRDKKNKQRHLCQQEK